MITTIKMAPEGVVLAGSTPAPGSESLAASAGTCAPLAPEGAWSRGENMPLSATCGGGTETPGVAGSRGPPSQRVGGHRPRGPVISSLDPGVCDTTGHSGF